MNSNNDYNPLAVICDEDYWKINNVSPMYKLRCDIVKLNQYAFKIHQALVNNLATPLTTSCEVNFEIAPTLKYTEGDPTPLMITVTSQPQETTSVNNQTLYRAILVSWGVRDTVDDAIHLPYMLESGEQDVGTVVKFILQTEFHCNITQSYFSQHQLLLFTANFLENDNSNNADALILSYSKPDNSYNYNLSVSFEIGYIRTIWNEIKTENDDVSVAISCAYEMLYNEVRKDLATDIPVLDIGKVAFPQVEITHYGVVKMKTVELVDSVFTVLNKISNNFNQMGGFEETQIVVSLQ